MLFDNLNEINTEMGNRTGDVGDDKDEIEACMEGLA